MDKKSITKREMEVRSRTEVKYLQVDLYTGPEVSPSRLVHRSYRQQKVIVDVLVQDYYLSASMRESSRFSVCL